MSEYFASFWNLKDRPVTLLGAGSVAEGRIEKLLLTGAKLKVVAPAATERIQLWASEERIQWIQRPFVSGDLEGVAWLFTASPDATLNRRFAEEARAQKIMVNVADDPAYCDFILPAILQEGPIQLAISSSGASPAFSVWLKRRLAAWLEVQNLPTLLPWFTQWRREIRSRLPSLQDRFRLWRRIVDSPLPSWVQEQWQWTKQTIAATALVRRGGAPWPKVRSILWAPALVHRTSSLYGAGRPSRRPKWCSTIVWCTPIYFAL